MAHEELDEAIRSHGCGRGGNTVRKMRVVSTRHEKEKRGRQRRGKTGGLTRSEQHGVEKMQMFHCEHGTGEGKM
jgi:hypothetical protein